jgi:hypothetical protein
MTKKQINQMYLVTAIKILKAAGQHNWIKINTGDSQIKAVARALIKSAKKDKITLLY